MNIQKISAQNSTFGFKLSGYTEHIMQEAREKLEKEANGRAYYLPLDSFKQNMNTIKTMCPDKSLETEEYNNHGAKYAVTDKDGNGTEFSINGFDPCLGLLAAKLKQLQKDGVI